MSRRGPRDPVDTLKSDTATATAPPPSPPSPAPLSTEDTPLLGASESPALASGSRRRDSSSSSNGADAADTPGSRRRRRGRRRRQSPRRGPDAGSPRLARAALYGMALHFCLAFCEMVLVAPLLALMERAVCYQYYHHHHHHHGSPLGSGNPPPREHLMVMMAAGGSGGGGATTEEKDWCKVGDVQHDLAVLRGWKALFDTIPVLLVAIPVGKLGDRYGHRKMMFITLVGVLGSLVEMFVVCAFPSRIPIRYVWLSSIILLCGGGLYSAASLMWSIVAESCSEEERSKLFYYVFSSFYLAELIGSFISSVTTDKSPWISCGLSIASLLICMILLCFGLSRPMKSLESATIQDQVVTPKSSSITGNESVITQTPRSHSSSSRNNLEGQSPVRNSQKARKSDGIKMALSNIDILLSLPVFLVGTLRFTTLNVLIQYSSVRFGWKISTGALFYTETAFINLLSWGFLIPRLSNFIRSKYEVSSKAIDLALLRASVCCMCVGALCIGISPTGRLLPFGVAIFASGFGSRVSALSLVSYHLDPAAVASIYSAISVLENIGHAVGDPLMQHLFAAAVRLPETWLPLPFFAAAVLYALAIGSSMFIRLDRRQ